MDKNKKASISVVIPVKNEEKNIKNCIEGILRQTVKILEIIVIDSGSTDNTLNILKTFEQVKTIEIPPSEFNHGLTRNLGAQLAKGDYILFTVGDARAYDEFWIEELITCFNSKNVAGVCGQQVVPHEKHKNPVEFFKPQGPPDLLRFEFKTKKEFLDLTPSEKRKACAWDDVNAMYRKDALLKIPFQKTNYSEDTIWARETLLAGYTLIYNYAARVYHYHFVDRDYAYKRTFTTSYYNYKLFGLIPKVPQYTLKNWISIIKIILLEKTVEPGKKFYWIKYNIEYNYAVKQAIIDFQEKVEESEQGLDKYHEKICGVPPIPLRLKS